MSPELLLSLLSAFRKMVRCGCFLLYIAPVIVIFQVIIIILLDAPKGDK